MENAVTQTQTKKDFPHKFTREESIKGGSVSSPRKTLAVSLNHLKTGNETKSMSWEKSAQLTEQMESIRKEIESDLAKVIEREKSVPDAELSEKTWRKMQDYFSLCEKFHLLLFGNKTTIRADCGTCRYRDPLQQEILAQFRERLAKVEKF